MISLEKAPQENQDSQELDVPEQTTEQLVKATADGLRKEVELTTDESDAELVGSWNARNEAESPDAIRRSVGSDRMDLAVIDGTHTAIMRPNDGALPNELAFELRNGDIAAAEITQQLEANAHARVGSELALDKKRKKVKIVNVLTLGIGAKGRNKKHAENVRQVDEHHNAIERSLRDNHSNIASRQHSLIDQHRDVLALRVRSADVNAETRQELVDQADNEFEATVAQLEELARKSLEGSYDNYDRKKEEVLSLLYSSPAYLDADPSRRSRLETKCSKVLWDALGAEHEASQASIGSHLVATVKERFAKGPAGGRLDAQSYIDRANLQAGGHWDEERIENLAQKLVKFNLIDGRNLSNIPPDLILDIAIKELQKTR